MCVPHVHDSFCRIFLNTRTIEDTAERKRASVGNMRLFLPDYRREKA